MKLIQSMIATLLFAFVPVILAGVLLLCAIQANGMVFTIKHMAHQGWELCKALPEMVIEFWVERRPIPASQRLFQFGSLLIGWPLLLLMVILDD